MRTSAKVPNNALMEAIAFRFPGVTEFSYEEGSIYPLDGTSDYSEYVILRKNTPVEDYRPFIRYDEINISGGCCALTVINATVTVREPNGVVSTIPFEFDEGEFTNLKSLKKDKSAIPQSHDVDLTKDIVRYAINKRNRIEGIPKRSYTGVRFKTPAGILNCFYEPQEKELGFGAFGTVYPVLNGPYIIKVTQPDVAVSLDPVIRSASGLIGVAAGKTNHYQLQEYRGESIDKQLKMRLTQEQREALVCRVLKIGLDLLEKGIVHHDLKPENIAEKAIDFDMAERIENPPQAAKFKGTQLYLPRLRINVLQKDAYSILAIAAEILAPVHSHYLLLRWIKKTFLPEVKQMHDWDGKRLNCYAFDKNGHKFYILKEKNEAAILKYISNIKIVAALLFLEMLVADNNIPARLASIYDIDESVGAFNEVKATITQILNDYSSAIDLESKMAEVCRLHTFVETLKNPSPYIPSQRGTSADFASSPMLSSSSLPVPDVHSRYRLFSSSASPTEDVRNDAVEHPMSPLY